MITERILKKLRDDVHQYATNLLKQKRISARIDSIILYGSAAKSFFMDNEYRDFDLNVFLVKTGDDDLRKLNKRGVIWTLPILIQNKKIEILFNKLSDNTWFEYVTTHADKSERWKRIINNPVLLLFPIRKNYESLLE